MNKYLKWGLLAMGGISVSIIVFVIISNLSCVSVPKNIEGEPLICQEAKQFVYLAAVTQNKSLPESMATESARSCIAKLRYDDCEKKRLEFLDKYKYDPNKYDIKNISLYNNANASFKDCLINTSK